MTKSVAERVRKCMDEYKVADALDELWTVFRRANKYIDETCPWVLAKNECDRARLEQVLYNLLEAINIGANLLMPFMPSTADAIIGETGGKHRAFAELSSFGTAKEYCVTENPSTLFERVNFEDIKPKIEEIKAKQMAEANAPEEEKKEEITIDDFAKVEMKIGTVIACEAVKKSKLLHETIKVGNRTLSVLSGIAKHYTPEEMIGKKVVVVTNLPPREMKGIMSEGMIVCAEAPDGTLSLVCPEKDVPDGSTLA